jgi:hypothetical protein
MLKQQLSPMKTAIVQDSTGLSGEHFWPASESNRLQCGNKVSNNQPPVTIFGPVAACGYDASVAEGEGDASSPVGQPPALRDWENAPEAAPLTLR